jgi:hypothetical protein
MEPTRPLLPSDDEDWVLQFVLSEEFLLRHHPKAAGSPYRRFESSNVIDLVRIHRQRLRADLALGLKKE